MERIKKILLHLENTNNLSLYYYMLENLLSNNENNWIRDFYEESPNWGMNIDLINITKTIQWASLDDNNKKEILDKDIESYFN